MHSSHVLLIPLHIRNDIDW